MSDKIDNRYDCNIIFGHPSSLLGLWSRMLQDAPPPVGWSVGSLFPFPPVGWLWGFWGFGFSLGLRLKGLRLRVDKGLGRICSVCSALGLHLGGIWGWVYGFKSTGSCVSRPPPQVAAPTTPARFRTRHPPPPPLPDHTMGGGAGNARRLTIYC